MMEMPFGRNSIFSAYQFLISNTPDLTGYLENKNLVQNVPMKQNFFSKFARNVKIKTKRVEGKKTKQTDKAFVSYSF